MGYMLLWIESLIVSLLLVACALACAARMRAAWRHALVWIPVALLPLLVYGSLLLLAGTLWWRVRATAGVFQWGSVGQWFFPLLALTLAYGGGVAVLRIWAGRPAIEEPGRRHAASWPIGKLLLALAVAVVLHTVTFWNLDLSVRQQLATVRAEAGALALSVAPARVPDRDNAALIYQQAFDTFDADRDWPEQSDKWIDWLDAPADEFDAGDAELRRFLDAQQPVITLLKEAGRKPGCYFDRDYGRPSVDMLFPELQHLRSGARLLALHARVRHADGDRNTAIENIDTMFTIAEHTASDPILISMLVAIAIDQQAFNSLQAVLASGPVTPADLDSFDLEPSLSYHRLFARALRMEEAFGGSVFCDIASGRVTVSTLMGDTAGPSFDGRNLLLPLYRVFLLPDDLAAHRKWMVRYRKAAELPFHEAHARWKELESEIESEPGGILTKLLLPALSPCAERAARGDANRRLARLAVASLRYRESEGNYPPSLDDLSPAWLTVIPRDPYDGQPMKLRRENGSAVIYSIGPDMTDNEGAPLADVLESGERFARGDIAFRLAD